MLQAVKALRAVEKMDFLPVFRFILQYCCDKDLSELCQTFSDSLITKSDHPVKGTSHLAQKWQKKSRLSPSDQTLLFSSQTRSSFFLTVSRTSRPLDSSSLLHSISTSTTSSPQLQLELLLHAIRPDEQGMTQAVLLMPFFSALRSLSSHLALIGSLNGVPENAVIALCQWFLLNESILHSSPPIPHNFTLHEATTLLQSVPSCLPLLSFFKQYLLLCELSDYDNFDVNRCVSDKDYRYSILHRAITSRNERQNELAFAYLDVSPSEDNSAYLKAYMKGVLTSMYMKRG